MNTTTNSSHSFTDGAEDCMERSTVHEIVRALITAGVTADGLFDNIRTDLYRGLVSHARSRLAFVDRLIAAAKQEG